MKVTETSALRYVTLPRAIALYREHGHPPYDPQDQVVKDTLDILEKCVDHGIGNLHDAFLSLKLTNDYRGHLVVVSCIYAIWLNNRWDRLIYANTEGREKAEDLRRCAKKLSDALLSGQTRPLSERFEIIESGLRYAIMEIDDRQRWTESEVGRWHVSRQWRGGGEIEAIRELAKSVRGLTGKPHYQAVADFANVLLPQQDGALRDANTIRGMVKRAGDAL